MSLDPPRPKSPPLNAMRAFEAAARLESFALAAQELNVTPSAVAHQVKALEAWAGGPLFERLPQGLRLTPQGREAAPSFVRAFDAIGDAANALRRAAAPAHFHIWTSPSVAQLWLSPRMPELQRRFPELTISATATEEPPNMTREAADLAIYFGAAAGEGVETLVLAPAERFPVCAPSVAARLETPADLAGETLLHDAAWRADWSDWLYGVDAPTGALRAIDGEKGPTFSLYSLALDAAAQGAGVLIGVSPLVEDALRRGALVRPFPHASRTRPALMASYRSAFAETMAARLRALMEAR